MTRRNRSLALPLSALSLGLLAYLVAMALTAVANGHPAAAGPSSFADQLLVKPSVGAVPGALGRALDRAGAKQIGIVSGLGVRVVHVPEANRGEALRSLRGAAGVAYAEPNGLTPPAEVMPNDGLWVNQWSQPKTHTDRAWHATTGSSAVKVAILDSGVDPSQPDLQGNLLPGRDFYNNDADPRDDYGHGTQVAGVAAGRSGNGIGVAGYCGGCSILPVKITGVDGYASWSAMASGIIWAADQGARVINLSFAGTSASTTVRDAIAYAHSRGALITVSAGNYGSSSATYPAAYPGALAVAATNGSDALESYSNYGSWVQLAAPGCNYGTGRTSSSSLFGNFCGTSSAAPALAGIAALAISHSPSASNAQVEQALEAGATPVGSFVRYGRVDAWATVAALGAAQPPATAPVNGGDPLILASNVGPLNGSPQPGQYLWASGGGWSGATTIGLAFQWKRCDTAGANCVPIPGATSRTYAPASADSGYALRTTVTATNSLGSASATSAPSPVVGGAAGGTTPANTSPPTITGAAQAGSSLSASTGAWSGSPTAYAYQWKRCDPDGSLCGAISGATAPTYPLSSADVGSTLRVAVTAANAYGSSTATSAQSALVGAAPPASPAIATTSFSGSISAKQPSKAFDLTVGDGSATATLSFNKAPSLALTLLAADGTTIGTASGASGTELTRTLAAGTYRYVVSGKVTKGSASFTLGVRYASP